MDVSVETVEGTCPTIRPMSVETRSIAIAAMDDSRTCECGVPVQRGPLHHCNTQHKDIQVRQPRLPHAGFLPVPLSGAIFRSESRGMLLTAHHHTES